MSNEYDHFEMSDEVLDIRAQELLAVIDIPHGEERDRQLTHELACIAFEQWARHFSQKLDAWRPPILPNSNNE